MTAVVKIRIENADQVAAAFKKAPREMTIAAHRAIQKSILVVESATKREAPVNKGKAGGNLRQSIRSRMAGTASGIVEVGAEYGIFVEEGTKPHIIRPLHKRVLARRDSGTRAEGAYTIFGKEVHHPGTQANPFFKRGIDKAMPQINRFFQEAVASVLRSI